MCKLRKISKYKVIVGIILLVHLIIMIGMGNEKINYHVDAYFSFALANNPNGASMKVVDGQTYVGDGLFLDFMTVKDNSRFNYSQVWENSKNDSHPPLFAVLVHTVCSFFPGKFSKWFILVINICFFMLLDIIIYLIIKELSKNERISLFGMAVFGVTLMTFNAVTLLRMYAMVTAISMAVVLLFCHYWEKERLDWKFYISLIVLSVAGTLTQYFFLVFLFLMSLYFGICLLVQRRTKEAICYAGCYIIAGVTAMTVYPVIAHKIFGGDNESKSIFEHWAWKDYWENVVEYCKIINKEIYGGLFLMLVSACVIIGIVLLRKKVKFFNDFSNCLRIGMLLFTIIGYVLLTSRVNPRSVDRYVMMVYPIIYVLSIYILWKLLQKCFGENEERKSMLVLTLIWGVCLIAESRIGVTYTYSETKADIDRVAAYSNEKALCVYKSAWTFLPDYLELIQYREYSFSEPEDLDQLLPLRNDDSLVVYMQNSFDNDEILQKILDSQDGLSESKLIAQQQYVNVYELD